MQTEDNKCMISRKALEKTISPAGHFHGVEALAPVWFVCAKQHREVAVKIVLAALKTVRDQVGTGALDSSKLTSRHLPRVVRAKIGTLMS